MTESYFEKCIQKLPPEKQAAAREAYKAISENGDDSLISKLLVVLEATAVYAETIPRGMVVFGDKFLGELDGRLKTAAQAQADAEKRSEERLGRLMAEQVPALGKALSLDKVADRLTVQTAELGRMGRSLVRLRHARVGGMLFLMLIGCGLGAGAVVGGFWTRYDSAQQALRFVQKLSAAGIDAEISRTDTGVLLRIDGPNVLHGTAWRKDANGYISGADFVFSKGGRQ